MKKTGYSKPGHRARAMWLAVSLSLSVLYAAGETPKEGTRFGEVTVTAHRPLADIGLQKAIVDSAALRDNISLSMADVLGMSSSLFVKSSGRATLSTVSFRGAASSHTAVTWNGLDINNPALGMTDFSLIPAYFVDKATLIHGASSVAGASGALGGLVELSSKADEREGLSLQFVQGVGSFTTFDEFLRVGYGNERWHTTTRVVLSSSKNDFPYTNHDRKNNIYDDNHNIIGSYYPRERNRNGSYRDLHVMQDVYYNTGRGDCLGLNLWYLNSNRNTPMLTTDYADPKGYENRQREQTFRGVASWQRTRAPWGFGADAGYIYSWSAYNYSRDPGNGVMSRLIDTRTRLNTVYLRGWGSATLLPVLSLKAEAKVRYNDVDSRDDASLAAGDHSSNYSRAELSALLSARWQATDRLGLSATLRDDCFGGRNAFIPAMFADFMLYAPAALRLKASVARNYHFPSLNDLYYLPGGNPDLRPERGLSYDTGAEFAVTCTPGLTISGSATWFESRIDDWIMWLPDTRGFFTPRNVKSVKSYGIEGNADAALRPGRGWAVDIGASLSWTPSVNRGEALSDADRSVGRQLPYIPRLSSSASVRVEWRSWSLGYKWCYYSKRYTMSSNESSLSGSLPRYYMSDLSVAKQFDTRPVDISLKLAVNNLFNADYQTILSRPMPGINFEFFVSITPKF